MNTTRKLTKEDYPEYLRLRKQGCLPRYIKRLILNDYPKITWDQAQSKGEFNYKGYLIRVSLDPDLYSNGNLDYYGHYSDTPGEDSIDRFFRNDMERVEYRYWIPSDSLKSTYAAYREGNLGKAESWQKALELRESAYKHCEAFNRGEWQPLVIEVKAFLVDPQRNIEIECAKSYLGGFGTDQSVEDLTPDIIDLAGNTVYEADETRQATISRLAAEIQVLADHKINS